MPLAMDREIRFLYTANCYESISFRFNSIKTKGVNKMYKRMAVPMLLSFLFSLLFLSSASASLPAAPLQEGGAQNGTVRVRLSSLGSPASLTIIPSGEAIAEGGQSLHLSSGASVTVKRAGGSLLLAVNGVSTDMGASLTLRRAAREGGFRIAQSRVPGNVYPGDLRLILQNGALYIVAHVYIEDYLLGVLPYEMGNSSGLEALKAQAAAARTYTLRAMRGAGSRLWDVVDTTADQVYNGTPGGNANCRRAVEETRGIVLQNGASLTPAYYTASNGGQTESLKNAWGSADHAALTVKDDPFDRRNPDAVKKSLTVQAQGNQKNTVLQGLLDKKAAARFGAGAAVTAVHQVYAHTPKWPEPSRLFTSLTFDVDCTLSGQTVTGSLTFDIFKELEGPLGMSINSMKNELWDVSPSSSGFTVTARRFGHGIGMSQRGAMQMAREGFGYEQILAFYYQGCTRVRYTFSRAALPADQPLAAVSPTPGPTLIPETPGSGGAPTAAPAENTAAPAGAEALAAWVKVPQGSLNLRKHASDQAMVLRTIPQNEPVEVLKKGAKWCAVRYLGATGYAMTRFLSFTPPTPPPPSSAPVEKNSAEKEDLPAGAWKELKTAVLAQVISANVDKLNLRAENRKNARILFRVPGGEYLVVTAVGGDWCRVIYQEQTAYCMKKYLEYTLYE